jgi:carbon storage regulator
MLVLSRKAGQSLLIGETVVKFKKVSGGRVVLCIDAPKEVKVLRKELDDAQENRGRG